jgi:hypothetical protein
MTPTCWGCSVPAHVEIWDGGIEWGQGHAVGCIVYAIGSVDHILRDRLWREPPEDDFAQVPGTWTMEPLNPQSLRIEAPFGIT